MYYSDTNFTDAGTITPTDISESNEASYNDLTVDSSGNLHFVYVDDDVVNVLYRSAESDATGLSIAETVAGADAAASWVTMDIEYIGGEADHDRLHVVFVNADTNSLVYTYRSTDPAAEWAVPVTVQSGGVGSLGTGHTGRKWLFSIDRT